MNWRNWNRTLILATGLVMALDAVAHHGWGGYTRDLDADMTIERVIFGFPHDRILVTDADGNRWNLLLAPSDRNAEFGYKPADFPVGEAVHVIGQQLPGRFEAKIHFINDLDGNNIYTYYYTEQTNSWDKIRPRMEAEIEH